MRILIIPDLYEDERNWDPVVRVLNAAGLAVEIASYQPPKDEDITELVDIANNLLVDETYVLAFGIGGRVAIELAARQPHHLAGIVLLATPSVPAPGFKAFLKRLWRMISAPIRILIPFRIRKRFMQKLASLRKKDQALRLYKQISRPTQESFYPKIKIPVLLLWGAEDTKVRPAVAEKMHALMRELEITHDLQVVAGGQHMLHQQFPKLVATAALEKVTLEK